MQKHIRIIVASLTICTSVINPSIAWADNGTEELAENDISTIEESDTGEIQSLSEDSLVSEVQNVESQNLTDGLQTVVIDESVSPSLQCTDLEGNGRYIEIKLNNYVQEQNVSQVMFAVWSDQNGQDDLKWYQADLNLSYVLDTSRHNDVLGKYSVHAYLQMNTGEMQLLTAGAFELTEILWKQPLIQADTSAVDRGQVEICVSDYTMPFYANGLIAAIWSEKDGQNDLIWSPLKKTSETTYSYMCNISDHKSSGKYQAHIYLQKTDGTMQLLGNTTFTVEGTTIREIRIEDKNVEAGTCRIVLDGVNSPSGIMSVQVPIWSSAGQTDSVWYQAVKIGEETYQVDFNIAEHNYNSGIYNVHVYATNGSGVFELIDHTTVPFENSSAEVTQTKQGNGYLLKASNVRLPGGVKNVLFAVWSEKNGQDDLKWYYADYNQATAAGTYALGLNGYKDFGTYSVHAYAEDQTGRKIFLGATSFSLKAPTAEEELIEANKTSGSFNITVKGIACDTGIQTVRIAVWSASDQNDIVWYTAQKNTSGDYVVNGNISRHKYHLGTYHAHVYVTDNNGFMSIVLGKDFQLQASIGDIVLQDAPDETLYHVTVNDLKVPAGAKRVYVAAWSVSGGQDDLKWYVASSEGNGSYGTDIDIRNHKTLGKYMIHIYVETKGGQMVLLGQKTGLEVNSSVKATVNVVARDENKGTFKAVVQVSDATTDVKNVMVAAWCAENQSDMVWYTATKQSDGTYAATIQVAKHKGNLGTYKLHAYVTMKNEIFLLAGNTTYDFNPQNFILILNDAGWGSRRVILKNASAGVTKVQFPVWSDTNGQDDIVWYSASYNSAGYWEATIKSSNHKNSGGFQVHAYINGKFVRGTSFDFPASEFGKNGWYYENGYKLYYQNDQLVTDVTSIIGPQSEYMAKVNRVTCTVTIYARDGANGFIIPVKVFACSVGLPGTETPLGTYHTLAKYRWHELMGPSYGQYCTRIVGGILFHSVAGSNMTSYNLSAAEYNKLGSPASHGCVRLNVRDAKWIYDNCSLGMTVVIYDSPDPGPFGKPATIKIPAGQNWDPTDPNI